MQMMLVATVMAVLGAVAASVLACVPGLHIYNVMGLIVLGAHVLESAYGVTCPPEVIIPVAAGLIVGYAMLNTVPSVLLAAPDESALFTVLPGQKYFMAGRGLEGTMITAAGGLAGLVLVVGVIGPLAPVFLPVAKTVFQRHTHWILWCVICFMLMSEWPKGGTRGTAGWRKFFDGWRSTGVGLLTFLLSGILGFLLIYRSPIAADVAFQNLMPAFVGLFTMPALVFNIVSGAAAPPQKLTLPNVLDGDVLTRGVFAGGLGGGFAAFFPVVTGGVGGMLAGHATGLRDDRVFLVSQGTSKLIYYVGAFVLFFTPGLHMARGGGAAMVRGLYTAHTTQDYLLVLGAVGVAGAVSFALVEPLARWVIRLIARFGFRRLSLAALGIIVFLVVVVTGLTGLAITTVAFGIGTLPVLFGSRRMNCLGVILLPMACNMSGCGPAIAQWLGLV